MLLLLTIAIVAVRVAIPWRWPTMPPSTDTDFHVRLVGRLRQGKTRFASQDPRVVGPFVDDYPRGLHLLLTPFTEKWLRSLGPVIPAVIDLTAGVVVGLSACRLGADLSAIDIGALAAVYALQPALTLPNLGPRSFSVTPRTYSQLLIAAAAALMLVSDELVGNEFWLALAGAAALLACGLLASKFTLQYVVAVFPLAALLGWSATPLVVLAGAAATLAVLVPRRFSAQVRAQYRHLGWYVARYLRTFNLKTGSFKPLCEAIRSQRPLDVARQLLVHNSYTSGFIRHGPLVAVVTWILVSEGSQLEQWERQGIALVAASAVAFVLTSRGRLRIFGESDRYLEFATPIGWILAVVQAEAWLRSGPALVLALVVVALYLASVVMVSSVESHHVARQALAAELAEQLAPDDVVLSMDITDTWLVYNAASCKVVYSNLSSTQLDHYDWMFERYPLVSLDRLSEIVEEYGVTCLIDRNSRLAAESVTGWQIQLEIGRYGMWRPKSHSTSDS